MKRLDRFSWVVVGLEYTEDGQDLELHRQPGDGKSRNSFETRNE